jgi:hypothetical protein
MPGVPRGGLMPDVPREGTHAGCAAGGNSCRVCRGGGLMPDVPREGTQARCAGDGKHAACASGHALVPDAPREANSCRMGPGRGLPVMIRRGRETATAEFPDDHANDVASGVNDKKYGNGFIAQRPSRAGGTQRSCP